MTYRAELAREWPAPSRFALRVGLVALVVLIGLADDWTGSEVSISIFFLIPIALGAWFLGLRTSVALAVLSAGAWLLADLHGGSHYRSPAIPYWNAAVGLGFFLIIAATLSARRKTERRILELMNVKSEFTSMVSHELRTPLTCIKEGIDIVADGSSGPLNVRQREHLETAKRNVDRLARLVNDVLTYQKLEARRMDFSPEPCDLARLVREAVEEFALYAKRKGLELATELDEDLPCVHGDSDRLRQVLGNLLSNALKFSEQGRVCVRARRFDGGVRVSVADQGVGIEPHDLPRLFQAFTRLSNRPSTSAEGTGLGLAIARQIVERHGGRLTVESQPGHGSTFHFTLPASFAPVPGAKLASGRNASARRR